MKRSSEYIPDETEDYGEKIADVPDREEIVTWYRKFYGNNYEKAKERLAKRRDKMLEDFEYVELKTCSECRNCIVLQKRDYETGMALNIAYLCWVMKEQVKKNGVCKEWMRGRSEHIILTGLAREIEKVKRREEIEKLKNKLIN